MSKRDLILLLEDMLESALKIKRYTASSRHGFNFFIHSCLF